MSIKEFTKKESGSTVVEASIVVPIVLMVIFVMMYLGFIMYQQTSLQVIANETASSAGQIYSTYTKDPFIGFVTPKQLSDTEYYRTISNAIGSLGEAHGKLESSVETKAGWYSRYRLKSSRLYKESAGMTINTDFEKVPGSIMQKSVVVTIRATYDLPFIRFFGIVDSKIEVEAVGRAQCFDILDTGSTASVVSNLIDETFDSTAKSVSEVVDAIKDFYNKYFGQF